MNPTWARWVMWLLGFVAGLGIGMLQPWHHAPQAPVPRCPSSECPSGKARATVAFRGRGLEICETGWDVPPDGGYVTLDLGECLWLDAATFAPLVPEAPR